jgi:hypothetical protein
LGLFWFKKGFYWGVPPLLRLGAGGGGPYTIVFWLKKAKKAAVSVPNAKKGLAMLHQL